MRPARRLELSPEEYRDAAAAERRQHLREVLAILRRAAAEGAGWYYDTLELCDRLRRGAAREPAEPPPASDPDSPFQAPKPRAPEPRQEQLRL